MILSAPSVVQALSPKIAIFSSDDVVQSCKANGLKGLQELFKPWENAIERVSILSSTLTPTIHPTFTLRFTTYDDLLNAQRGGGGAIPYSPEVVVDVVSNLLNKVRPEEEKQYDILRDVLLSSSPIAEHETFNHPVCFILATSTSSPDPIQALQRLQNTSLSSPVYTSRPFMDGGSPTSVLRFWLLVHDVARDGESLDKAQQMLQQVKRQFGPQAALLVINSAQTSSSAPDAASHLSSVYSSALSNLSLNDPFLNLTPLLSDTSKIIDTPSDQRLGAPSGLCAVDKSNAVEYAGLLSQQDVVNIRGFLKELTSQSLVPWMEARVREWNEVFAASRRGITGRLFGAGRKFFGGGKPAPSSGMGYNTIRGYYPPTSPEAITRRLADFAFMLRDYRLAGTVYDSIRRDYIQDGAIKLGASATEMYGIASLFGSTPLEKGSPLIRQQQFRAAVQETESWLEQAVTSYQSRQVIQLDAMRATVLFYETWKGWAEIDPGFSWKGISPMLVTAAGDAEEAPSAIMLEQAANLDLRCLEKRNRKHAFHLVMAARRYEKSGHKPHSRKCLERAIDYYRTQSPPWTATQDHIEYSLGRQAYTLGQSELAVEHFLRLLRGGAESAGQTGVLEDFSLAYQQYIKKGGAVEPETTFELPCAIFDVPSSSLRDPEADSDFGITREQWKELEERFGAGPSMLPEAGVRLLGVGDRFLLTLTAVNPINAPIHISNLQLEVTDSSGASVDPAHFVIDGDRELYLEPLEVRQLDFGITASTANTLTLQSISFSFHDMLPCRQVLSRQGRRLYTSKEERLGAIYAKDHSNTINVIQSRPRLHTAFSGLPHTLLDGELVDFSLKLTNKGRSSVDEVSWIAGQDGFLSLISHLDNASESQGSSSAAQTSITVPNSLAPEAPVDLLLPGKGLSASESISLDVRCFGRQIGAIELPILIRFRQDGKYHVTRCHLAFDVIPFLSASASASLEPRQLGYTVKTTITNTSQHPCVLEGTTLLSPAWTIRTESQKPARARDIQARQSHQEYVRVLPIVSNGPTPDDEATADGLLRLLGGQSAQKKLSSSVTILRSSAEGIGSQLSIAPVLSDRRLMIARQLSLAFPQIQLANIPNLFPLIRPFDVDLALSWTCSDGPRDRRGWAVIRGLSLGCRHAALPSAVITASAHLGVRAMYEETNRRKLALTQSILNSHLTFSEDPLQIHAIPLTMIAVSSSRYVGQKTSF